MPSQNKNRPSKGQRAKNRQHIKPASRLDLTSYVLISVIVVMIFGGGYYFVTGSSKPDQGADPGSGIVQTPGSGAIAPTDADSIARGAASFEKLCISCHGKNGVGEKPEDMYAVDASGLVVAPPLDGSAHAWHHSDEDLIDFILNGSPQNPRMRAWKDTLDRNGALELVAYMKSLWPKQILACQGEAHMAPECQALSNTP